MDQQTETGKFIKFNLNYDNLSNREQAEKIVSTARSLLDDGVRGVAITYSANYGQTRKSQQVYFSGGWDTGTSGANQAEVMTEMETFLKDSATELRGNLRILPITTMNGGSIPTDEWNVDLHRGIVITDLDRVQRYLDSGWVVLGWQNQKTVDSPTHPFAIGGGVASLPDGLSKLIQRRLIDLSTKYL